VAEATLIAWQSASGWALGLGLLGALIGSFVATLVLRWTEDRSVLHGRSACDGCGRTLRAHELVPLLSALVSRGQCRRCGGRIDPLHWQIEAAALAIGAIAGWVAPGATGIGGAVFGWLLLALGALDARAFWLPDRLVLPLAAGGIVAGLIGVPPALTDRLIAGVAGFALLWLVAAGYRMWRGREGLGGGDPKLLGAIGLWLGWRMLPAVLLCGGLIGMGVVLFRQLTGRPMAATDALPLGTLMALAAYPAWLMMIEAGT
jgi:leader peptidase (prepilin peptidase)/N-methyltransferase